MIFDEEFLMDNYRQNSDGLSPEEFLEDRVPMLLGVWIDTDNGKKIFRQVGPYWETLHEILRKFAPDEFEEYERIAGPFTYFNEEVKKQYDYRNNLLNFMAALAYQEKRYQSLSDAGDVHILIVDGEDVPYMPNQNIDPNYYHGREDLSS